MHNVPRSDAKILDDIKSVGQGFLGNYMEDLLKKAVSIDLEDKNNKNDVIEEYYNNQRGFFDKDKSNTRTRVNAALRIIKADKVLYALQQIDGSDKRVDKDAVQKAKSLCERIEKGEIPMPKLYL